MASFTDTNLPTFNPYVQQLPVEAMVQVGIQKQAQYEQGVTKIQNQIDNIAGMDVIRDVDKNYLQSKLNQLGNDLTTVAAGDFSNFQLVNSVGGMATQISKDKYVQAAVSSTANHRKQVVEMEAEKKKGTLTPDNEFNYSKKLASYLDSTDIKDAEGNPITFSGKYSPHFDVWKFAKETFDAVLPDEFSFDQVYLTDKNGNPQVDERGNPIYSPVMIRMEKEGRFPEKVKQTLEQIFSDPRVSQQLSISGEYTYRGLDENALSQKVLSQKTNLINAYDDKLKELTVQQNLGKDVQTEIDNVTLAKNNASAVYDEYVQLALENPDVVRGQLYKDDVSSRYTTMFGQIRDKKETMENPGWNANFKLEQEANKASQFAQQLAFSKQAHRDNLAWKQKEYNQKQEEIDLKKDAQFLGANKWTQTDQAAAQDIIYKVESDYDDAATTFKMSSAELVWSTALSGSGTNDQQLANLISRGMSRSEAIVKLIAKSAKESGQTTEAFITGWGDYGIRKYNKQSQKERDKTPSLKIAVNAYTASKTNFDGMVAVKTELEKRYEQELGVKANEANLTGNIPAEQTVTFEGKNLKLNKKQVFDMAVYLRGERSSLGFLEGEAARNASKEAYKRLEAAGLGGLATQVLNNHAMSHPGSYGPATLAVRGTKAALHNLRHPSDKLNTAYLLGEVDVVFNKLNNEEFEEGLIKKSNIIKQVYGIRGNKKTEILTGNTEVDKNTIFKLRGYAGAYGDGQTMNLSRDFEKFAESISGDITGMSISTNVYMDRGTEPQIEIVSYDKDGERAGGMTIQPDEAAQLGIDVNKIYEPKDIGILRNKINIKGGKTSNDNPSLVSTYLSGDAQYDRSYFPAIEGSPYDVKGNIVYKGGVYYPYIYVSDGRTQNVRQLPGSDDLYKLAVSLQKMSPAFAQQILNDK